MPQSNNFNAIVVDGSCAMLSVTMALSRSLCQRGEEFRMDVNLFLLLSSKALLNVGAYLLSIIPSSWLRNKTIEILARSDVGGRAALCSTGKDTKMNCNIRFLNLAIYFKSNELYTI